MSVFKTLKGTFQNVQQDIVDGFRALTSLDATPRHEKLKQLRAEGISLDGGADLLYRYQKNWSEMQNYTTESAKKAEEVDNMIGEIFKVSERQWHCMNRLEEEMVTLPALASTLDSMIKLVGGLQEDFKAVEEELDKLLNITEEETLVHERQKHAQLLTTYRKQKETEVKSVKGKLWKMLSERAKEVEARKSYSEKARQDFLMEAFTTDMEYYKTHGRPDRLSSGTEFPKVSSLSEMTIDEDKKELDEFLSSEERDDHAGGAFIEDDYTADYSHPRPASFSDEDSGDPADLHVQKESETNEADNLDAIAEEEHGSGETEEEQAGASETQDDNVGEESESSAKADENEGGKTDETVSAVKGDGAEAGQEKTEATTTATSATATGQGDGGNEKDENSVGNEKDENSGGNEKDANSGESASA